MNCKEIKLTGFFLCLYRILSNLHQNEMFNNVYFLKIIFCLNLTDGQDMAKRISKQLSSNSEKIKKTLKEFNSNFSESVSFAEVSMPSATIFKDVGFSNLLNEEKIQACQTYCLYQHAVEQEKMTILEMKALLHHTERENQNLLTLIVESAQDDRYQLGRKHMLMMFIYPPA